MAGEPIKAAIVRAYHGMKYRLRPVRYDLTTELAYARRARDAEVEGLAEMDAGQLDYLTSLNLLSDPLTDGIEHEHG